MRSLLFAAALSFALCGCSVDQPTLGPELARDTSARSGHVFLVRGLLGVFSTGMDELCDELRQSGIPAVTLQHTADQSAAKLIAEHPDLQDGPLIIVGHSLGAGAAVDICQHLQERHIPVDLLITLDPVSADLVPSNVKLAVNYYRSGGGLGPIPLFRGVKLRGGQPGPGELDNVDLNQATALLESGTNHFNIDTNRKLQDAIMKRILALCPPTDIGDRARMAAGQLHPVAAPDTSHKGNTLTQ